MKQKILTKIFQLAPLILIGFFAVALALGAKNDSVSNDESAHIPAGWSYAKLGVYRLNDEHPPLMKLLSGLFLLPFKLNFPSAYSVEKFTSQPFANDFGLDQWKFGDSFLFESGNNLETILFWARMPAILMALGTVYLVFLWTKKLTNSRIGEQDTNHHQIEKQKNEVISMRDDEDVSSDTSRRSKEEIGHFSAFQGTGEFNQSPSSLVAHISQDMPRSSFLEYKLNSLRSTDDGSYPALLTSILALALAIFSPIMLAQGRLANTDTPLTFFYFLFFYILWWFTEKPNFKRAIILGLSAGATLCVKFSAPLIVPIAFILIIIKLIITPRPYPRLKTFGLLFVSIIFGILALWLPYAISQRNEIADSKPYQLKQLLGKKTISTPLVKAIILPADMYWQGFSVVSSHSKSGHPSYLNGETHITGHREYFPIAFLLKTPLPLLFLLLVSFFTLWLSFRQNSFGWLCVLIPIAGYFIATLFNNIHIGIRHLMPIYPLTIIMASAGTFYLTKYRAWRFLVATIMIFYITDSALHYPSYMAYFNQLIGSNHNHYKYLSDSNIDWYQDQKRMARYLTQNNISVIRSNTPSKTYNHYGVKVVSPTDFQDALPGEYIVSAGWDNSKLFNQAEYRLAKHIGFSTYLYQKK